MPIIFYSGEEFRALKAEVTELQQKLDAAEAMRPHWAQWYSSDSIAAPDYCRCPQPSMGAVGRRQSNRLHGETPGTHD